MYESLCTLKNRSLVSGPQPTGVSCDGSDQPNLKGVISGSNQSGPQLVVRSVFQVVQLFKDFIAFAASCFKVKDQVLHIQS